MRSIHASKVVEAVERLCISVCANLPCDVLKRIEDCYNHEDNPIAIWTLEQIIQNAQLASVENSPLCQDTGFSVFFVKLGREVEIADGDIYSAIAEGVSKGHLNGYLRKSIVRDPLDRASNTGDNTPPIIWLEIVEGNRIEIIYAPKGGGSENMSRIAMLKPADGIDGVRKFVLHSVIQAGGNPCPPVIVGVGIGGTFEKCAFLAKKALLRDIGQRNKNPFYADLENTLLSEINETGVGPMGMGGKTTALDVFIEVYPCHIASLPVAVNLNCHCARHGKIVI
ncbi:fumarate hydratase [bacterium]|nr:fumarate hydratase [bacterium]